MKDINTRLAALGIKVPELLLPKPGIDLEKWAVIACDQYTQDSSYWEAVSAKTAGAPSALNLILPEIYLGGGSGPERIRAACASMKRYRESGVFSPPREGVVYIERSTPLHPMRRGLVLAVDLEQYDWRSGKKPLIRATEETIEERLPPRMEIRRGASLETPHIILLMDDEEDALLPACAEAAKKRPPLYSTGLMMKAGSVTGWALESEEDLELLAAGFERLAEKSGGFPFAVGDGNHSLATAKAVWDEYRAAHKNEKGIENHPARWALVELENLYDPGIDFEPIHRVVFGADPEELLKVISGRPEIDSRISGRESRIIRVENKTAGIVSAFVQPVLDAFIKEKGLEIDYIHGEEELFRLARDASRPAVGLLLPPVRKNSLFKTVAQTGALPRKSFSMGTAEEKRFYLECRSLFE